MEARDGGSSSSDAEAGGLVVVEGNATAARQEKRERREEEKGKARINKWIKIRESWRGVQEKRRGESGLDC